MRSLRQNSFKVAIDNEGHSYVAMRYNAADKTHHGIDSKERPRMYETNQKLYPEKSFEKIIIKKKKKSRLSIPYFRRSLESTIKMGQYGMETPCLCQPTIQPTIRINASTFSRSSCTVPEG